MRFLKISDSGALSLVERPPDSLPPYAILSHTWGATHEEVNFQDFLSGVGDEKVGYRKLVKCGKQAALDGFEYFWSDTCCIDKTSSAELSEAINSMYSRYQAADVCYAYLADVNSVDKISTSRWFTRGWTLQELLAPSKVVFFDGDWNQLGTSFELQEEVSACTRIPTSMLSREKRLETFSIAQRMSWAAERRTTRIEDMAYCLMGIFDINMPLIYGEGENAFIRLQEEIMRTSDDHSLFIWRSSDDRGGCLATSPASFRSSSKIVQTAYLGTSYDPAIVSSRGVHLNVRFVGVGVGRLGIAILNCCEQGREDERVAIYLRDMSLTMELLERSQSEEILHVSIEGFPSQYPIRRVCIRKTRIRSKQEAKTSNESHKSLPGEYNGGVLVQDGTDHRLFNSLFEAVRSGSEDDVWLFLTRQDIDVNEEDMNRQSILSYATANGKETIVRMLLSRTDIQTNGVDVQGRSPLFCAVENGHRQVVKLLLETGKVDVNLADKSKLTPLTRAVEARDTSMIKLLLGTGRINVEQKDGEGRTPLSRVSSIREGYSAFSYEYSYTTAMGQRIEAIKMLLQLGKADVNSRDKDGRTPLSWATESAVAAMASERY
jgi:hypothetical protein